MVTVFKRSAGCDKALPLLCEGTLDDKDNTGNKVITY
jgi:hypothetical protein